MESVSHAGCVIGILAPGEAGSELGKELATVRLLSIPAVHPSRPC